MLNKKGSLILVFALLLIPIAYAQVDTDIFGFLAPDFITQSYQNNFEWWDFFIYFALFALLIKGVFKNKFGDESLTGKIAVVMGLGLSLTLVLFEANTLGDPLFIRGGPVLGVAICLFIGVGIYRVLKGSIPGWITIPIAVIIPLLLFIAIFGGGGVNYPNFSLGNLSFGSLFPSSLGFIVVIVIIVLFLVLAFRLGNSRTPGGGGGQGGGGNQPQNTQQANQPPGNQPAGNQPAGNQPPNPQQAQAQQLLPLFQDMQRYLEFIRNNCIMISSQSVTAYNLVHNNKKIMVLYQANLAALQAATTKIVGFRPDKNDYGPIRDVYRTLTNLAITDKDRKDALNQLENILVTINNKLIKILNNKSELNDVSILLEKHVKSGLNLPKRDQDTINICGTLLQRAAQIRQRMP